MTRGRFLTSALKFYIETNGEIFDVSSKKKQTRDIQRVKPFSTCDGMRWIRRDVFGDAAHSGTLRVQGRYAFRDVMTCATQRVQGLRDCAQQTGVCCQHGLPPIDVGKL